MCKSGDKPPLLRLRASQATPRSLHLSPRTKSSRRRYLRAAGGGREIRRSCSYLLPPAPESRCGAAAPVICQVKTASFPFISGGNFPARVLGLAQGGALRRSCVGIGCLASLEAVAWGPRWHRVPRVGFVYSGRPAAGGPAPSPSSWFWEEPRLACLVVWIPYFHCCRS